MNIYKAKKRDKKRIKRLYGHYRDGDSVFLIRDLQRKRSLAIRLEREKKLLSGGDYDS